VDTLQALAAALLQSPKPVVAAVHGWVVGAGLELMLNADLAIAARSARFALPEAALGLLGTGGVGALLPRAVGLPRAKGLLMLGTEFTAADAERCGLLWAVVDDAELTARTFANFLWVTFTRSNPAVDVGGVRAFTQHKAWGCHGPVLIDARSKPHHAPPLVENADVTARVDRLFARGGTLAKWG